MTKILFVCHGNICRSPMAEFVMKDLVKKAGLESLFSRVDDLVVVGNEVFSDGAAWGPKMTGYLAALARAQRACAAWADAAGEVSSGAVTWHKRPAGRSDLFWKEVSPG